MLQYFVLSFLVSVATGYFILRWQHVHARFTSDRATPGSHKIHTNSVPRIGGVAIVAGWTVGLIAAASSAGWASARLGTWIACLLPAFAAGLVEDLTGRVSVRTRLVLSFATAALGYLLLNAIVDRLDFAGVDTLLAFPLVSFLFTLLAVGGVAHAVNIIDGLNGLALGICLIALLALGYVAFQVHDGEVLLLAGIGAGAVLGLLLWNYPSGEIFCGDGGAYFLGAYVAMLSALLVHRNASVSAWFPLMLVAYPVWETMFSVYRRRLLRGHSIWSPDRLHMHTLVYKRVARRSRGDAGQSQARRNSDASAPIVMLAGIGVIPAVLWWGESLYLVVAAWTFALLYVLAYRRIVGFGIRAARRKSDAGVKGALPPHPRETRRKPLYPRPPFGSAARGEERRSR